MGHDVGGNHNCSDLGVLRLYREASEFVIDLM